MKKIFFPIILLIIFILGGLIYLSKNPLTESSQPTPVVDDSQTESNITPAQDMNELSETTPTFHQSIRLETPQEGDRITSPLFISGEAKGSWFFEATFPIVLTDWNGLIISEGFATTTTEDWMTEEFIPFEAQLEFEKPDLYDRGSLILKKNNPSDKRELDDAYEITIFFE